MLVKPQRFINLTTHLPRTADQWQAAVKMSASIRAVIDKKPSEVQAISSLQSMIWNYSCGLDLKDEEQAQLVCYCLNSQPNSS